MTDINQILNELYEIDPALRQYEKEITKLIGEMLRVRPDTKFDAAFAAQLREKLAKPTKFKINFNFMKKSYVLAAGFAAIVLVLIGYSLPRKDVVSPTIDKITGLMGGNLENNKDKQQKDKQQVEIKKFASKEEFLAYLEVGQAAGGYGIGGGIGGAVPMAESRDTSVSAPLGTGEAGLSLKQAAPSPDRTSQTNVQVKGIDEPDIVKTNGQEIFVSTPSNYVYQRAIMEDSPAPGISDIWPPAPQNQETKVIGALPADKIKQLGKIDRQGEMLLTGETLIIFENNYVYGYDVKQPEKPQEKWKIRLENSNLTAARLLDGKVYLVSQTYVDYGNPCPLRPLYLGDKAIEIPCTEIYHPVVPVSDTVIYHAFRINPGTGEVEKNISFVGSSGQSVVYMSNESLYITYVYSEDQVKILADFLKTSGQGLLPQAVIERINKLFSYDISAGAKQTELMNILQKHYTSLNQDDRRKLENDMENKLSDYVKAHIRDLTSTGLVKIALSDFGVKATGKVAGVPLNQFALDEYKGNLRIATTISGQGTLWGGWRNDSSANDVYVLDGNLDVTGSITDLGLTERIYSARFVGERGFLVTFRQTDPFYVLDLSNPKNPKKTGELKIPGFSSYLHPLKDNLILGVGQENGRVKLSLFDVLDSANPKEVDKYSLDEYWSEAQNNHHAFLQDEKYEAFFLPGGNSGYVFLYKDNKLSLQKVVSQIQAQRALYVNDYLYVVGSDRIAVLSEKNWERVGELVY